MKRHILFFTILIIPTMLATASGQQEKSDFLPSIITRGTYNEQLHTVNGSPMAFRPYCNRSET